MISTTCSLKWVNELQHEILSQLIICFTLGITLAENQYSILKKTKVIFQSGVNKHKNQLTLDFMDQIWPCVHTKCGTFPGF